MQSYEVQPGHTLILRGGVHVGGDVIPGWFADIDNGLAGRIAVGCLAPTDKRPTLNPAPPAPKVADDPAAGILAECERLTAENAEYAASNRNLAALNDGLAKEVANLTAGLGRATADIAHLTAACDDHQAARDAGETKAAELAAKVADLTAELEAATAPAAEKHAEK